MRQINAIVTGPTNYLPLDPASQTPFNIGMAVLLTNSGLTGGSAAGGTWAVQYTHNDVNVGLPSSWVWFNHPYMSGTPGTGNLDGNIAFPCGAVRLNVLTLPTGGTEPGYMLVLRQTNQRG